jgi:glycosyltransferase involved in cell wall biosynthesis
LADALGRLLGDAALRDRLGAAAAARIAAEFSFDAMIEAYEALYAPRVAVRRERVAGSE